MQESTEWNGKTKETEKSSVNGDRAQGPKKKRGKNSLTRTTYRRTKY